jgi:thiol-disulfide isomerase/thioredoxin
MITSLNLKDFKTKIVVERETCVVKFYSDSCPLCVHLSPVYEEIADDFKNRGVSFYKVDVAKEKELTDRMNFDGVPTLFLFYNGRYSEIPYPYDDPDDLTGYRKSDIVDYINKRIAK